MTKHTPGPWSHNDNTGRLTGANKKFICTLDGQDLAHSLECRANARMIAAAPELLSALEDAVSTMPADSPIKWVLAARAVIAKATKA